MTTINMLSGEKGDKIKIDDNLIILKNSYKLITVTSTDGNCNKYYEIETNNKTKFKINEEYLLKIISVKLDDIIYYPLWFYKDKKIIATITTSSTSYNINIVKYLFDKINDTTFKYSIRSDDEYDYRFENIKVYKPSNINYKTKIKKMTSPPIFYKEDEIKIIKEFKNNSNIKNDYRLVEIINEADISKKRYYEMFVGVNNTSNEYTSNKFSFIFDEASLPKILKLEINKDIITNNLWEIGNNQYIWIRPKANLSIYLHRYLMGCKNGDNKSIDHINNNKLDNRLCNLRVANMSEQNMNRPNVNRKNDLNSILNPTNDETIPKIETKSLLFINKKASEGSDYFSIEISKARTRSEEIRDVSSKSNLLTLKEKLCHAIYKRYEIISKFPIIMKEQIDDKKFTSIDEFKIHSENKINEIIGNAPTSTVLVPLPLPVPIPATVPVPITYTLDSFLDYLNTKKIPKYLDPRIKLRQQSQQEYVYNIDDKYSFIDNGKNSRDITIKITTNIKDNIRLSGSGSKKLSETDKLCYAILNRYFVLIEHENAINLEIHKDNELDDTNTNTNTINKNTTGKKTLTDLEIDGNKFNNFNDFKTHTIKVINDIMKSTPPITIEIINKYFIDKINDKRCKKLVPTLNTKYSILTT